MKRLFDHSKVNVGHFNNYTYIDIVTSNVNSSDISILLGYGNGSFIAIK